MTPNPWTRAASDELYHASWANVSDRRGMSLPFAAHVLGVNARAVDDPYKTVTPVGATPKP
jgi:hypothetical protein